MDDEKKTLAKAPALKADVVRLEVPGDVTSLGIEGQVFSVVEGVVEVPRALLAQTQAYLNPLWRKLRDEAKQAEDAAIAAAERAKLPDFARGLLERIEALEKQVLGR